MPNTVLFGLRVLKSSSTAANVKNAPEFDRVSENHVDLQNQKHFRVPNRLSGLALSRKKALPIGHPDGRNYRICDRDLFDCSR